jgi:hypothetical protein
MTHLIFTLIDLKKDLDILWQKLASTIDNQRKNNASNFGD